MINLGETQICLERKEVLRNGTPQALGSRAFDILDLLLQRRGQLVSKEDMLLHVWPDNVVVENNLQVHISSLRKVLGEDRELIRTVPGRGYLLLGYAPASAYSDNPDAALSVATSGDHRLPTAVTLIGRDNVLAEIQQALRATPILSLVGPGGIGKTALAVSVCTMMPFLDHEALPVCFVALAELRGGDEVIQALAESLNIENCTSDKLIGAIAQRLNETPRLLVFDNCEHVIEMAAVLAEHIVRHCPSVKILATSREPLRITSERTFSVPPLGVPGAGASREQILQSDSARLFLRHMHSLDTCSYDTQDAALDDQSVQLIATACRRLEGIALALEMAAARAATLGLFELVASLNDNLHLLSAGLRSTAHRHQSLQASLEWSYQSLNEQERQVLGRIGRLEGSLTLDHLCTAGQAPGVARGAVMECVIGLAQKSLLQIQAQGPFRFYRLLESTRACLAARC
jgi:predicted ATPase/DNA-binding winged helix-turn-helix (wHTH) protein